MPDPSIERTSSAGFVCQRSPLVRAGFVEHIAADWEPSTQQSLLEETTAEKVALALGDAAAAAHLKA